MDDQKQRRDLRESLDIAVGFLGFFAAAFFVITLVLELNAKDALWSSITTLVLVVLLAWLWRFRRRAIAPQEPHDEP
jgi:membrane protein implicated in regulation of membrane protease activity